MKLTTIRHTRVEVPAGICYGQSDVSVNGTYPDELKLIRSKLAANRFDQVYSSPLSRCRTLANDLFPRETICFDERLMELNFGRWEMQHWDEISQTAEAKVWFNDFVELSCPGGESFRDQINRTADFIEEVRKQNHQKIALVVHGGIIRVLNCLLNGVEPVDAFQHKVDYGEVLEFSLEI